MQGSYGTSGDSDGNARKATFTAGVGDLDEDDFNAFFSLDVSKTDEIRISDRRNRKWIGTGDIRPWGYDALGGSQFTGRHHHRRDDRQRRSLAGNPPTGTIGSGAATMACFAAGLRGVLRRHPDAIQVAVACGKPASSASLTPEARSS